jgi:toxin ParE1/3/4
MTREYPIVYTERAQFDLFAIGDYLRDVADVSVAERFVERIVLTVASLRQRPKRHRIRRDAGADIRAIRFRTYLIFYRVDGNSVVIVRILHASRDITRRMLGE